MELGKLHHPKSSFCAREDLRVYAHLSMLTENQVFNITTVTFESFLLLKGEKSALKLIKAQGDYGL